MDTTTSVLLVGAVIGATQTIKHTFGDSRISGFLTILVTILIGLFAGYFQVEGLSIGTGVLTALGAIGASTIADRIGTTS